MLAPLPSVRLKAHGSAVREKRTEQLRGGLIEDAAVLTDSIRKALGNDRRDARGQGLDGYAEIAQTVKHGHGVLPLQSPQNQHAPLSDVERVEYRLGLPKLADGEHVGITTGKLLQGLGVTKTSLRLNERLLSSRNRTQNVLLNGNHLLARI